MHRRGREKNRQKLESKRSAVGFWCKENRIRCAKGGEDFSSFLPSFGALRIKKKRTQLFFFTDLMIMTAAVDMKPTLTIIKAEKMDGE